MVVLEKAERHLLNLELHRSGEGLDSQVQEHGAAQCLASICAQHLSSFICNFRISTSRFSSEMSFHLQLVNESGIHWIGDHEHGLHVMGISKFQDTELKVTLILGGRARTGRLCLLTRTRSHCLTVFQLSKVSFLICATTILQDLCKIESPCSFSHSLEGI